MGLSVLHACLDLEVTWCDSVGVRRDRGTLRLNGARVHRHGIARRRRIVRLSRRGFLAEHAWNGAAHEHQHRRGNVHESD
jgi:hypothetical protein